MSLNGTTGEVIKRAVPLVEPAPPLDEDGDLATVLRWVDAYRELDVRANADDADDARRAFRAGAAGVGLARTEHMFFGSKERVDTVRRLVLADDDKTRAAALQALLPLQRADFAGLFRAAGSRPVCVRLLDPPLHEFLPKPGEFESTPPFDAETLTPGETTQLEATLRRLARGEPCGDIARAAAEAADGVAEMLARAPR